MKNIILNSLLALSLMMGINLNTYAADIPHNLQDIKNISHPAPHQYGAGQPPLSSFPAFAEAGVKHVINLRPPTETPDANEAAAVTKAGMAYYNVPIANVGELTRDRVKLIDQLLKQIGDEGVLLHCSSSNRVGAIIALRAAWLQGASHDKAIAIGQQWGLTKLKPAVENLLKK